MSIRATPRLLACLGGLLGAVPMQAHAGAAAVGMLQAPPPDSAAVARAARRAQYRFEVLRRAALPLVEARGAPECEARTGRYCYWHDGSAKPPDPREQPRVTSGRTELLRTLDSLARLVPADSWIAGQRVRYRLDAGDTTDAVRVAERECRSDLWWCAALQGHARHAAGDHPAAAHAFDVALSMMDAERRCDWDDPSVLLDPDARDRLRKLPCEARAAAAERIWWLATPLFTRAANDLRTEFHARHTAAILEANARHVYATSWGWDTRELLLRYGAPIWWTRERRFGAAGVTSADLVGHEATPSFSFLPAARLLFDDSAIAHPGDWDLERRRPPSRYAPSYVSSWTTAAAQVARFIRGDSLLVVAAYSARHDTLLRAPVAHLAVSPAPVAAHHVSPGVASHAGVLELRLPRHALRSAGLASVEVVDTAARAVARHRTGIAPLAGGRLTTSDLLLHRPLEPATRAATLAVVAPHALDGTTVTAPRIGLYWETYGVPAEGELLDVALTLERTNTPWLRRAAARVGLASRITPLRIRWRETPDGEGGAAPRSVVVNVGALARGEYQVTLTVRGSDGTVATSRRHITVAR